MGNPRNIIQILKIISKFLIEGCLKDERRVLIKDSKAAAIERIWRIGGNTGYYALNWAWHLRGLFDQMIGGVGLNRGRRHPSEIQSGRFNRFLESDLG